METPQTIRVNGVERRYRGVTIAELVSELGLDPTRPGLAVAVDGEVVPRGDWARRSIRPGDAVEVVGATQGG